VSPTSEQSAVAAVSHDASKFSGLGGLSSVHHISPSASSDNVTEEECTSDEEDDSKDDNPITSTPILQQQPATNQQVRILLGSPLTYFPM